MPLPVQLTLSSCPRCGVKNPALAMMVGGFVTKAYDGSNGRVWATYVCSTCGGMIITSAPGSEPNPASLEMINEILPSPRTVSEVIPEQARQYLTQAQDSLHAPDGAVMLAASAVDAMLKAKNYRDGSLYSRIDKAAADHVITQDMARWAHHVRLEA